VLYRCVQEHLETWLAQCREGHDDDEPVPEYVEREFRRYLECGLLAYGLARARCGQCGHDFLIAFSCKGHGVCPSCNTRRMVATAAHLTDHVLPPLPVRQWVLAVPKRLRYFLQRDAGLQGAALRLFLRVVEQCLRAHSPDSGPAARLGAVAFIHRFGSTLNPHLHFHCVVIDGVFEPAPADGVVFHAATGLDANTLVQMQAQVRRRLLRVFVRRGLLPTAAARLGATPGGLAPAAVMRNRRARRRARATRATRENTPTATHNHSISPSACPRQPAMRCHRRHFMRLDFLSVQAAFWPARRVDANTRRDPWRAIRLDARDGRRTAAAS
jgi:hypothetical protein